MEEFTLRQNKVSRLVQKELADIFIKELRQGFSGVLVSVTIVRVTRDLSLARCYLSLYPNEKAPETLQMIKNSTKLIRGHLGTRIGKQVRVVPQLEFFIDDSLNYLEKIDQLLEK